MSNAYPVQSGISVMMPYNVVRLVNGLVLVRHRATGDEGIYTPCGCYQSGKLRLAAWVIRPLFASIKVAA